MKVIAGTGANSTAEALELTRQRHGGRRGRHAAGDALLQQAQARRGCSATSRPWPTWGCRWCSTMFPAARAARSPWTPSCGWPQHPKIVAIKEAGGSVDRVSAILDACGITVLSGDDSLTLPMMAVGAKGVISVASNVIPADMVRLTHAALAGRWEEARELHRKYLPAVPGSVHRHQPDPGQGRHGHDGLDRGGVPAAAVPHVGRAEGAASRDPGFSGPPLARPRAAAAKGSA